MAIWEGDVQIGDGIVKIGDPIWLVTCDGVLYKEIKYITSDIAVFLGWHCELERMKELAFTDKKKADMVYKLQK
jgi:hypothetical protein